MKASNANEAAVVGAQASKTKQRTTSFNNWFSGNRRSEQCVWFLQTCEKGETKRRQHHGESELGLGTLAIAPAGTPAELQTRLLQRLDGIAMFAGALTLGLEGIVAKDAKSPDVEGPRVTWHWQKIKNRNNKQQGKVEFGATWTALRFLQDLLRSL